MLELAPTSSPHTVGGIPGPRTPPTQSHHWLAPPFISTGFMGFILLQREGLCPSTPTGSDDKLFEVFAPGWIWWRTGGKLERGSLWRKDTALRQSGTIYLINYHQSTPERRKGAAADSCLEETIAFHLPPRTRGTSVLNCCSFSYLGPGLGLSQKLLLHSIWKNTGSFSDIMKAPTWTY